MSSALAGVGPAAHDAIMRRLADASTRGAMCRGITSKDADADARKVLLAAPVSVARRDGLRGRSGAASPPRTSVVLGWMAERAEPGLLGAAGKERDGSLARSLHVPGPKALAARPVDDVLRAHRPAGLRGQALHGRTWTASWRTQSPTCPATHAFVVEAIDPFTGYGNALRATCAALPMIAGGRDSAVVRERANDALDHACKAPG